MENARSALLGFNSENPRVLTPAAADLSLSQLSASTPSQADTQSADVVSHPPNRFVFLKICFQNINTPYKLSSLDLLNTR